MVTKLDLFIKQAREQYSHIDGQTLKWVQVSDKRVIKFIKYVSLNWTQIIDIIEQQQTIINNLVDNEKLTKGLLNESKTD